MTVESTNSKESAQQMGLQYEYDFSLDVLLQDPTDIEALKAIKAKVKQPNGVELDLVWYDEVIIPEDEEEDTQDPNGYMVTLNSDRSGGKITVTRKRTAENYIIIYREYTLKQEADYQDFNAAPADTFEQCFDKLTMLEQQQQEELDRCVKVTMTSDISPEVVVEQVARVYESIDNVDTVANNISDVNTVSDDIESVNTVSGSIANVNAVGNSIDNVNTVALDLTNVDTVAENIENVNKVGNDITNVNSVADDLTNIDAVADNEANINTVATNINTVNSVGANIEHVIAVDDNKTNINAVNANKTNIDAVAGDLTNINSVAGDLPNIDAASSNAALSKQYAIGVPTEPPEGSAKYWAGQSAQGQVQSDWEEADNTKKSFIKNKPDLDLKQNVTDNTLTTTAKTIVGAINEVNSKPSVTSLSALTDVTIATPTNGQTLKYNSTSQKWENGQISSYHPTIFSHQWSDCLKNDIQWLRADTFSWQDGTVYSEAYNHLVDDIDDITSETETISGITITFYRADDGHKICLANQEQNIIDLYTATGIAWYYILDTANTRFKLPRSKYGFVGYRDEVGKFVAESLPNITGIPGFGHQNLSKLVSGCYKTNKRAVTHLYGTQSTANEAQLEFNASLSSSAYQDNAPVQQKSTQMYLYFYVGQFSQTATEQTAGLNAELFNGKLDLNASNLSTQGKSYVGGLGMPTSRYIDLTLGASGATYTAPANGYFKVGKSATASNQYISGTQGGYTRISFSVAANNQLWDTFPVKKGTVFTFNYSAAGTTHVFKFYYAEGAN